MKTILLLIRAIGVFGAFAIVYWLMAERPGMPPDATAPGALDHFLYFALLPFSALVILLLVPYTLLPSFARKFCRLLLLLLGAYYLFYRFAPYFLPGSHPYAKPEPLSLIVGLSMLCWIVFFLAQLFAIYHLDGTVPQLPPGKGGPPPKPPQG